MVVSNASSWILYSDHGYECFATFSVNDSDITYTIEAEDGGYIAESCNSATVISFDLVEVTTLKAHYGCSTHVRFQAPNTLSQPFVIRIASELDDISTKFAEYKKSWSFGNLTITPLICAEYSNIIPLRSPFTLHGSNNPWHQIDNPKKK
eukprot:212275_1